MHLSLDMYLAVQTKSGLRATRKLVNLNGGHHEDANYPMQRCHQLKWLCRFATLRCRGTVPLSKL